MKIVFCNVVQATDGKAAWTDKETWRGEKRREKNTEYYKLLYSDFIDKYKDILTG